MTDKEWNELCDWVKSLKINRVKAIDYNDKSGERLIVFYGAEDDLRFYKDGDIYVNIGCLRGRRTPEQIKAIIENLL